jgi:hypothetical protein
MSQTAVLVVMSLLSNFLVLLHVSEDIVRGYEPGGLKQIQTLLTMGVWLYGTVGLAGRRAGYVIVLLGSLLGTVVSLAHMRGVGMVGGRIANSDGMLPWVFTQILLGVVASVTVVLAAQGLWRLRRAQGN